MAALAVVLLAATIGRELPAARWCRGCLAFAAAGGMTGILLDVQDGPVRTVQLAVLFSFFLAAAATIRLIKGSGTQASSRESSS